MPRKPKPPHKTPPKPPQEPKNIRIPITGGPKTIEHAIARALVQTATRAALDPKHNSHHNELLPINSTIVISIDG
jgi:hypothetical protein